MLPPPHDRFAVGLVEKYDRNAWSSSERFAWSSSEHSANLVEVTEGGKAIISSGFAYRWIDRHPGTEKESLACRTHACFRDSSTTLHTIDEQNNHNPIPFLIFAALIGLLFGKWWLGLLIGIGMTIVPGVATIGLMIQNVLLRIVGGAVLAVGFPFYLAFTGIRRLVGGRGPVDEED